MRFRRLSLPPVVTNQMLAGIGDVLSDFGQKIERIEHLKVALRPGQKILPGRFGESTHPVVILVGLNGECERFRARVGVDDETEGGGDSF